MTIPQEHIQRGAQAIDDFLEELQRSDWDHEDLARVALEAVAADIWREGHDHGVDYQGDGWNCDTHDPENDNPYKED